MANASFSQLHACFSEGAVDLSHAGQFRWRPAAMKLGHLALTGNEDPDHHDFSHRFFCAATAGGIDRAQACAAPNDSLESAHALITPPRPGVRDAHPNAALRAGHQQPASPHARALRRPQRGKVSCRRIRQRWNTSGSCMRCQQSWAHGSSTRAGRE